MSETSPRQFRCCEAFDVGDLMDREEFSVNGDFEFDAATHPSKVPPRVPSSLMSRSSQLQEQDCYIGAAPENPGKKEKKQKQRSEAKARHTVT